MSAVATAAILAMLIYANVGQAELVYLATFDYYEPAKHGWQLPSDFSCLASKGTESKTWGSEYSWVAYCLPNQVPIGEYGFCGACVRIRNEQARGNNITARIVDQCSESKGGFVLDYETVFEPLDDPTGIGRRTGEMFVSYEFVTC